MAIPKARIRFNRPQELQGRTYKITATTPQGVQVSFYITINEAMFDDQLRPVEVFINTKDMANFQWIDTAMQLLSVQLQQPGPFPKFVLDVLKESYDPGGGYFIPGTGKRVNGVVAHIGLVIEARCKELKLI